MLKLPLDKLLILQSQMSVCIFLSVGGFSIKCIYVLFNLHFIKLSWPLSVFTPRTTQLQTFIMFGRKNLFFPAYFGTNTGI